MTTLNESFSLRLHIMRTHLETALQLTSDGILLRENMIACLNQIRASAALAESLASEMSGVPRPQQGD